MDPFQRRSRKLLARALLAMPLSLTSVTIARADDEPQVLPDVPVRVNEAAFNQLVLGGRNITVVRQRLDTLLALKIEDIDRTCKLSEEQKEKLRLAGRGDIKRLNDRIDEARKKLVGIDQDQGRLNVVVAGLRPLQQSFESDPFDEHSIFTKTLKNCLTEAQAVEYGKVVREKLEFRFRSTVELVVTMWDRAAGLRSDQRKKLREVLLAETKPPRRPSEYDTFVVLCQAATLPESKLKPLFDEDQWLILKKRLEGATRMVPVLLQGGYLPEEFLRANPTLGIPPA